MARVLFTGPTPPAPNPFTGIGEGLQGLAAGLSARRDRDLNARLVMLEAQRLGLDPNSPEVQRAAAQAETGGIIPQAPLVREPSRAPAPFIFPEATRQGIESGTLGPTGAPFQRPSPAPQQAPEDPRLAVVRAVQQDPMLVTDPRRFQAVLAMLQPGAQEEFGFEKVGDALFRTDPRRGTAEQVATAPAKPVTAQSGIAQLVQDFRNGLLSQEDFLSARRKLLESSNAGEKLEIREHDGALVAVDARTGAVTVIREGTAPAAKDQRLREAKITELVAQGVDPERAARLVDKFQRIEIVPQTGMVRLIDEVDQTVQEVPVSRLQGAPAPGETGAEGTGSGPPTSPSLFELAELGTGPFSAARAGASRLTGLLGDPESVPIAEKTIAARQALSISVNELIRSLAVNPRFPVAEQERIREEASIAPELIDSPRALQARMRALDTALRQRMTNAERDASDPNLPQDMRSAQAQNARAIRNFLGILGVPNAGTVKATLVPPGQEKGATIDPATVTPEQYRALTPEQRQQVKEALLRQRKP